MERHYYKDFITGKRHFTQGQFIGWSKPTGLLNAEYAGFQRPSGEVLWIPKYLLENKQPTPSA